MKIPICMPTYNRPEYLKATLDALSKCIGLENYEIITSEEPCPEVDELLTRELATLDIESTRHKNKERLGNIKNCKRVFELGFATGAEWIFGLEDDIVLAKDALLWMEWAINKYWDEDRVIACSAFTFQGKEYYYKPENLSKSYLSAINFSPWGWATTKHKWDMFAEGFDNAIRENWIENWDIQASLLMRADNKMQLRPVISRSENIGVIGDKTDEEWWESSQKIYRFIGKDQPNYPLVKYDEITEKERQRVDRAVAFQTDGSEQTLITREDK